MASMLYHFKKIIFVFLFINVTGVYSQIVINEVNHRPTDAAPCPINPTTGAPTCQGLVGTGREFVELYNPTCNAFDLSGFIIASRSDVVGNDYGGAFRFPAGASIPPNGIVSFGSGDAGAPAVTYGYNAAPAGDKRVGPKGWLLPNTEGWIALYRPNGTCYQLVYYASSGEGTACITNGSSEFLQNPLVPTNSGAITLLSANAVFTSTPAVCQYIGPYANVNTSMARVPDGGTWQTNRAATPTACNSTCNVISTINFTASVSQPTCGNNNGSITLNVTSAGAATFSWSPNPSPTNTTSSTTANNLSATSYTISVTQSGCTKDTIITLTATGKPNAGSDQTGVCGGTSATLTGTSPTTGTWSAQSSNPTGATLGSTVGGISSVAFAANASGVYNFIYSSSGCTDTMNITVNPKPNAGSDQTNVCAGTSATLTGTNPTTGTWTAQTGNPAGATLGSTAGGIAAVVYATSSSGVYNFIYTANGCSDTMNITVTAKPNAGIDQTVNCFITGTATMAGSGAGSWSFATGNAGTATITTLNSATTTVTNFSTSGTYNLVWTNNGCSDTARITVNNSCACPITNNNLTAPVSPNCAPYNGTTINGSAATPAGGTYTWQYSNGGGFANASGTNNTEDYTTGVLPSNTHQFRRIYTTTSGIICSDTSNVVTIVVNVKPNANAGLNKVLTCTNPTVTLDGSSTTTGVSYSWTGPGIVSGGSIATPVVNASGTYTLTVTVNSTNCQQTDNVDVTSNGALPNADAGLNKVITCTNPTVILDGSSTTSGVSYSWTGPGVVSGGATAKPTVNAAGAYTLTVTITATGCQQTDIVNVTNNTTLPNANAGSDKILTCILTDVLLDGSSTTSGVSYAWTGPGIVSGGATATPDVNKSGIYTLTVTNPVSGCKNTDQVEVFNNGTLPNADAGLDKELTCTKTSVILDGSSTTTGVTYTWIGPGILSGASSATPTVNTTGTYTVTVTETATGCKKTDQVLVTKNTALPNINAGNPKVLTCTATTVLLNGSSSTTSANPSWAGPGIVNGQSTFTPTINTSGTYTLTMTDTINGCVASASVLVTTDTLPPVLTIISSKNPAEYNEIINLTLNSNATISAVQWQPAALVSDSLATQVSAQISSPTTFIVNATDSKGCSGTTSLFVNLFNVDCIYVPNTFTPDANGKNEVFKPLGSKLKTISIFRIFDRWGNMVFETTDVSQGWDGTYKGKLLEPGVYVYYIEGTCITNNKEIIKGDVTLIR